MKRAKLIAAAIIVVLFIVLIVQNREPTDIYLLVGPVTMPRAMLVLVTFLMGAAVGFLTASILIATRRKR